MLWSFICWSDMLVCLQSSNHAYACGYDSICCYFGHLEITHLTCLTAARVSKLDGDFCNSSVVSCTFMICTCNSDKTSWTICAVDYVLMAFKRHAPFMCSQRQTVFLFVQLTAEHWRHRFVLSNHCETHWNHLLHGIPLSRNLFWRFNAIHLLSWVS